MDNYSKICDIVVLKADQLSDELKEQMTHIMEDSGSEQRSILVTFDLSHSGKIINNRMYSPWGQQDGTSSWTEPYPRPILVNHDKERDPLGRIVDVKWETTEQDAIKHLGSASKYMEIIEAFQSRDASTIYKTMAKHDLLTDKKWPGLGRLRATARISDKEAIKKFLDGRYLTFSAGSYTDTVNCMVCGHPWHEGGMCEHRPGMTDDDGNLGVVMTGKFMGREASVVNMPADSLSLVKNIEFSDSENSFVVTEDMDWSPEAIQFTDAVIQVEAPVKKTFDLEKLEPATIVALLADESFDIDVADQITGETHLGVEWMRRVHDQLHREYDFMLGHEPESIDRMPRAVFALHGAIHATSIADGFRDSLINGSLDQYDQEGKESTEYVASSLSEKTDAETVEPILDTGDDNATNAIDRAVQVDTTDGSAPNAQKEEKEKEEVQEVVMTAIDCFEKLLTLLPDLDEALVEQLRDHAFPDSYNDEEVDWFMLDLALQGMMGDAKLSTEKREKLDTKVFCGPDRSFPVNDCAHYTAAKRLVGRYKGPGSKTRIRACIERRGRVLKCSGAIEDTVSDCNCKILDQDYAEALCQVDTQKTRLRNVLIAYSTTVGEDNSAQELDFLNEWFDNMGTQSVSSKDDETKVLNLEDIKAVANPGGAGSQHAVNKKKDLTPFEKKFIDTYAKIQDLHGVESADTYFRTNRRFLPAGFNLSQHVNEDQE